MRRATGWKKTKLQECENEKRQRYEGNCQYLKETEQQESDNKKN